MPAPASLSALLARGDVVAVDHGRLTLKPASGLPVPSGWLEQNDRRLLAEAGQLAGVLVLEYLGYSTGNYGSRLASGVTLQFRCLEDETEWYAIFNADTKRTRTTKHGRAGDSLPDGQFRVGKRSDFFAFWQSTGIALPRRLSAFHDCMGKLGALTYTATRSSGERLNKKTLRPLNLPHGALTPPDKRPTTSRQTPDNFPTTLPYKELPQTQHRQGLQPEQTTGGNDHGKTVTREHGHTGSIYSPESQSNDDWLADYNAAGDARHR